MLGRHSAAHLNDLRQAGSVHVCPTERVSLSAPAPLHSAICVQSVEWMTDRWLLS